MQTIYIGPSRRDLDLKNNRIYTDRPVALIKKAQEIYPLIGRLFVPVDDLGKAQDDRHKAGSLIYIALQEME